MLIFTSRNFDKAVAGLPSKVKESLRKRLEIFRADPYAKLLNNHGLQGSFRHYRSINITGDYRLIYEEHDDITVRLIDIGRHRDLYGR